MIFLSAAERNVLKYTQIFSNCSIFAINTGRSLKTLLENSGLKNFCYLEYRTS